MLKLNCKPYIYAEFNHLKISDVFIIRLNDSDGLTSGIFLQESEEWFSKEACRHPWYGPAPAPISGNHFIGDLTRRFLFGPG